MRFQISANPGRGIRVIPEIPAFDLCHVEGRNGVGKSLALRLLELCSGVQPYANAVAEWRSLRESLGSVIVTATSLVGAERLEWELTPNEWPKRPERVDDWLGQVTVDGEPQSLDRAYGLLRFSRIAGDETLTRTIARQVQTNAELVYTWAERLSPVLSNWDVELRNLSNELAVDAWDDLERAPLRIEELGEELASREREYEALVGELAPLRRALQLRRACEEVPALDERAVSAAAELVENEQRQQELEARRSELLTEAMTAGRARDRLDEMERLITHRTKRVRNASLRATELAAASKAPSTAPELTALIETEGRHRDALVLERTRLDATPALRTVAERLAEDLDQALDRGLANEVVAVVDNREVTVHQLADGVERQLEALSKQPVDERTAELDAEVGKSTAHLQALSELADAVRRADRARELLDEARREQQSLQEELAADAPKEYAALASALSELREDELHLRETVQQLERDREALGGRRAVEEIRAELSELLRELDLNVDEVAPRIRVLEEDEAAANHELERLRDDLASEGETLAAARAAFRRAIAALARSAHWEWLRQAINGAAPDPSLDVQVNLERLRALGTAVDHAAERLNNLRNGLPGVGRQIEELANAIDSRSSVPARVSAGLVRHFERELLSAFDQPELRTALFNRGQLSRIDLDQMTISWTAAGGDLRTRPFEAFSSGERVFAYTRARLEALGATPAQNHVVALDEFGAYVARDRLDELVRFVEHRVLGELATQVVIVLPLARDYVRERERAGDSADSVLKDRARAILQQGYFAEPFIASA
jgi:hypothetical protein